MAAELFDHLRSVIRRAVVADDHFIRKATLAQDTGKLLWQEAFAVVGAHCDRYRGSSRHISELPTGSFHGPSACRTMPLHTRGSLQSAR